MSTSRRVGSVSPCFRVGFGRPLFPQTLQQQTRTSAAPGAAPAAEDLEPQRELQERDALLLSAIQSRPEHDLAPCIALDNRRSIDAVQLDRRPLASRALARARERERA